jgi:hypothetical protein
MLDLIVSARFREQRGTKIHRMGRIREICHRASENTEIFGIKIYR